MKVPSTQPFISSMIERRISFQDTDAMGVVWFGNYLRYMEYAREELFRKIGYGYKDMFDSGFVWPIIDVRMKYVKPATVEQQIQIHAHLVECEYRIKIEYLFLDKDSGEKLAYGYSVQVAVNQVSKEMQLMTPKVLLEKLNHMQEV